MRVVVVYFDDHRVTSRRRRRSSGGDGDETIGGGGSVNVVSSHYRCCSRRCRMVRATRSSDAQSAAIFVLINLRRRFDCLMYESTWWYRRLLTPRNAASQCVACACALFAAAVRQSVAIADRRRRRSHALDCRPPIHTISDASMRVGPAPMQCARAIKIRRSTIVTIKSRLRCAVFVRRRRRLLARWLVRCTCTARALCNVDDRF